MTGSAGSGGATGAMVQSQKNFWGAGPLPYPLSQKLDPPLSAGRTGTHWGLWFGGVTSLLGFKPPNGGLKKSPQQECLTE
jgi:hypothetical protein